LQYGIGGQHFRPIRHIRVNEGVAVDINNPVGPQFRSQFKLFAIFVYDRTFRPLALFDLDYFRADPVRPRLDPRVGQFRYFGSVIVNVKQK